MSTNARKAGRGVPLVVFHAHIKKLLSDAQDRAKLFIIQMVIRAKLWRGITKNIEF